MNKDNQEIEIKIKLDDTEGLKKKVQDLGGKKIYESLEQDVYYDNDAGFYDSGKVLRIRKENAGTLLTYKDPLEQHDNLLSRGEIQTRVKDTTAIELILGRLGYKPKYQKERRVVHFELDGLTIEFHTLPFMGEFLEIEAEEEILAKFLLKLGLNINQGIPKGYHTLFSEYKKNHNLPDDLQLTFEAENR